MTDYMSRGWEIAREAALLFGGSAASYFRGSLKQAHAEIDRGAEPIEKSPEWQHEYSRIPYDELPVVHYYDDLSGPPLTHWVDWQTSRRYGSSSFWMRNRGRGKAGPDDIDLSVMHDLLIDGLDYSVDDFAEEFTYVVRRTVPNAYYDAKDHSFHDKNKE